MFSKFIRRAPRWQVVLAFLACVAFSKWGAAQTTSPSTAKVPKFDITKSLGDVYAAAPNHTIAQARLVVYRPRLTEQKAGVISVYFNDHYHTSLQQDAFSVLCLDQTQANLRTRFTNAQGEQNVEHDTSNKLELKIGQSTFVRLVEHKNGLTHADIVSMETANQDLSLARQQKHALSRSPDARACKQDQETIITFGSEAVFSPEQTTLSSDGEKEMLQIVDKINRKYKNLEGLKVHVVGYADDTPEEGMNEQLSIERANVVKTYLASNGVQKEAISHEGRGSRDKQIAMNVGRPGRRVEVAVVVELR